MIHIGEKTVIESRDIEGQMPQLNYITDIYDVSHITGTAYFEI